MWDWSFAGHQRTSCISGRAWPVSSAPEKTWDFLWNICTGVHGNGRLLCDPDRRGQQRRTGGSYAGGLCPRTDPGTGIRYTVGTGACRADFDPEKSVSDLPGRISAFLCINYGSGSLISGNESIYGAGNVTREAESRQRWKQQERHAEGTAEAGIGSYLTGTVAAACDLAGAGAYVLSDSGLCPVLKRNGSAAVFRCGSCGYDLCGVRNALRATGGRLLLDRKGTCITCGKDPEAVSVAGGARLKASGGNLAYRRTGTGTDDRLCAPADILLPVDPEEKPGSTGRSTKERVTEDRSTKERITKDRCTKER